MMRKMLLVTGLAASLSAAAPAFAFGPGTWYGGSSSSGSPPTGTTSSGGSTQVPEPGVLGLLGAGLIGLAVARRRKSQD